MSNRQDQAIGRQSLRLQRQIAREVTYRRGAASATILAILGRQLLRTSDRQGNTKVERTDQDFVFDAADLVLAGRQESPRDGDRIDVDYGGGVVERYEVMPYDSEPSWRYQDPGRVRIRVHTKHVGRGV